MAIDNSRGSLQEAQPRLERAHLEDKIALVYGDVRHLKDPSEFLSPTDRRLFRFDVIFARNVMDFIPAEKRVAMLQR